MALYQVNGGGTIKSADVNQCVNAINGIQAAQALGVTSGPTTTSLSPTAMTDMSVALTTVGGTLKADWSAVVQNSAAADNVFAVPYLDGVAYSLAGSMFHQGTNWATIGGSAIWTNVTPGSHTIAIYWWVDGGTATANSTRRQLTVLNLP